MSVVLKYLKRSRWTILLAVFLLMLKVGADLALPLFTSKIVNIGIQQKGIEGPIPIAISEATFTKLLEIGDETQKEALLHNYTFDANRYDAPSYLLEREHSLDDSFFLPLLAPNSGPDFAREQTIKSIEREYEELNLNMRALQSSFILRMGSTMLLISLFGIIASIFVSFFSSRVAATFGSDLREALFTKTLSFNQSDMTNFSTASLITRSTNDVQQIQRSLVMLLRIVVFAPLMATGGLVRVLQTNVGMTWIIGLAILAILTVVMTLFIFVFPRFKQLQLLLDDINKVVRETLSGLQVIRAFNTQEYEKKRFENVNERLTRTSLFVNRVMGAMMPLMTLIMNLTMILIVFQGGHQISGAKMQVGDMMAFMQYTMLIIMSFLMMTMLTIMIPRAAVSVTRIAEVLQADVAINESLTPTVLPTPIKGEVKFDDVSFSYPHAEASTLCNISFSAKRGTTTAIIGSTGSGKSTLLSLLLRFHDVSGGSITLDGVDIRELSLKQLRSNIGYVPQQGFLFSGTIESNISFGREITEEQKREAATISESLNFIEQRSGQFSSLVTQKGGNLSGGQRQRLSIARAIGSEPQLLLFDDSFSALDYKTELKVRSQLYSKMREATIFVVSQRVSSIMHADTILVLDEGRLVDKGSHKELLERCRVYQEIALSQLSQQEIELS